MLFRRLTIGLLALALALTAPSRANQSSLVTPAAGPMSMSTFVSTWLNPALLALGTCSSGNVAPTNGPSISPFAQQCWWDTSVNPWTLRYYDGTQWVGTITFDPTGHIIQLQAPTATVRGGVNSITAATHQWVTHIDTAGLPHQARPDFSDLTGSASLAQGGLGGSQSAATANQIPVFPGSGGAAVPNSAATWFDGAFCNTVGWLVARTTGGWVCAQNIPANVEWFGVLPGNSAATNSTNLASLISTLQSAGAGGLYFPGRGYQVNTSAIIAAPMTISCAYRADPTRDGNIRQTAASSIFLIRSGYVTLQNCSTNGGSTPIMVGDDALSVTNGANVTSGNTTLTCSGCTFTAADVGKQLSIQSQSFLTSIAAFTDATHVVLALAPGFSNAAITFAYGFNYQEIRIVDNAFYNFTGNGINVVEATQYHIRGNYIYGPDPLRLSNIVWSDEGDGFVAENTFIASTAGSHNTVIYTSGGALKFENNKVLAQAAISACFSVQWSGVASLGPFFVGNSVEGSCVHGFELASAASGAILHGGTIVGNHLSASAGNPGLYLNPTNGAYPNWVVSGNFVRATGASVAVTINNMTVLDVSGNSVENVDGASGGTAYSINNSTTGTVRIGAHGFTNSMNGAAAFSTGLVVDNQTGMTFANLPTAIGQGSRIFVTDGTHNSSPATSGGSGCYAYREGAGTPVWNCW